MILEIVAVGLGTCVAGILIHRYFKIRNEREEFVQAVDARFRDLDRKRASAEVHLMEKILALEKSLEPVWINCPTCKDRRDCKHLKTVNEETVKGEWIYRLTLTYFVCKTCGTPFKNVEESKLETITEREERRKKEAEERRLREERRKKEEEERRRRSSYDSGGRSGFDGRSGGFSGGFGGGASGGAGAGGSIR